MWPVGIVNIFQMALTVPLHIPKVTFTHARSGCGAEAGGFWYSRSATAGMFTHTRSVRGRICHFLRTMMVWSARFRSGRGKLGVGPISCGAVFAPAPPPLRDRACVNACNDLCWSQLSARVRPRMCERTFTACLPLGLCKGTVKESNLIELCWENNLTYVRPSLIG